MIFETKNQILKRIVLHSRYNASPLFGKKEAGAWSASFFNPKFFSKKLDKSLPFHKAYLCLWMEYFLNVKIIVLSGVEKRHIHNKTITIPDAMLMGVETSHVFVPVIDTVCDIDGYVNCPVMYKPFLSFINEFKRVIFYIDKNSNSYYEYDHNKDILYLNNKFTDQCPMSVIYEASARHKWIPFIGKKLDELWRLQDDNVIDVDGYSEVKEERFVKDFVAHRLGHHYNVSIDSICKKGATHD